MKKIIPILMLVVALSLSGCSYNDAKNSTVNTNKNAKTDIVNVSVNKFYNGKDGFSLSIPSGNDSTCIWTYEGGSASVPYSVTTNANTATEKHTITFISDTRDSYSNFKVTCVDDFGNQYIGIFPVN
ncbi:MAG: hypothetical protein NTY12_05455 [Candidatus Falkowbacteria bacterium]|nr:hypothetical protein [Candidatus Falkowbacteria bacterium]